MQNPGSPNFEPAVPLSSISADGQYQLREQRTRIDQEALNASVLEHGVLTPVLLQEGVQGNFVLIDGYGRFNAAFANNLETVPGFIFSQGLSVLDIVSMAIASNKVRKNLSLFETYQGLWRMMTEGQLTLSEAAKRCGMKQAAAAKLMAAIQSNPKEVINAFVQKKASVRGLYALRLCRSDDEKRGLAKKLLSGEMTVSQLEDFVNAKYGRKKSTPGVRFVVSANTSYEAVLAELARIKKRVVQLERMDVDVRLLPAQIAKMAKEEVQ